ncbi:MAG: hypothetical protein JWO80_5492 [Bryobacterales bacterium]|nr:hypothetical protein [Bryobacterales bacterium]
MQRVRITKTDIAALLVLIAAFLFVFRDLPSRQPYYYDESDYMIAGSRGIVANALEQPSMSIVEFLQTGLNIGMKAARRTGLSELVRGRKDITFYRHYHGPLYYYWLAAIGPLVHQSEYPMRFSGLVIHVATFCVIYIGVLLLTGARLAALISSFLFLFGQANIGTDTQISPHIMYVFFTVLTLLLFAGYLETGSRRLWYFSVAAFTGAFCSIDYAILLLITFGVCFFALPERRPAAATLLRSAGLFLCLLLILWPMGLIELSAIKGYFFIAYLAMQRKGSYGDDGPFGVWLRRFAAAPVEYSLDLAALFTCMAMWRAAALRRFRPVLLPCLVYAALMLLTTLKNTSMNPTYVASILPPLAVVTGIVFFALTSTQPQLLRVSAAALLLVAIALGGYTVLERQRARAAGSSPDRNVIAAIRDAGLERSTLLVPYEQIPTLSFYFPELTLHPYLDADGSASIVEKLRDCDAQGFLYKSRPGASDLPQILVQKFHVRLPPVEATPGETLYRIDGRT